MLTVGLGNRSRVGLLTFVATLIALAFPSAEVAAQTGGGPSEFCHVVDGTFTDCGPGEEWSDITPTLFNAGGVLYVDQADLDPVAGIPGGTVDHLMLMYESGRTAPLGPDEYVLIHFMTVDADAGMLLHYAVRVYSDQTIQVFIDGVDQGPGRFEQIDSMRGALGFGPSPTNPADHVLAEFQIGLTASGLIACCYSPDPAWWSSSTPAAPPPDRKIAIPTLLSSLANVDLTLQEEQIILGMVNEIFQDQGAPVEFVRTESLLSFDGDVGQDGIISLITSEGDDILSQTAEDQLEEHMGGIPGIHIKFASDIAEGRPVTIGAYVLNLGDRTALVDDSFGNLVIKSRDPVYWAEVMARTIAHEILHMAGVDDDGGLAQSDPFDQDPVTLGSQQVFDPVTGQPELFDSAKSLSEPQKTELLEGLRRLGIPGVSESPVTLEKVQFGFKVDNVGDAAVPYLDLNLVELWSVEGEENIELRLAIDGVFPASGPVSASYRLLFDADNDTGTGLLVEGFPGIEKEVRVDVFGDQASAPLDVSGFVVDHVTGSQTPLPVAPELSHDVLLDTGSEQPVGERFFASIPRSLLSLVANEVAVTVISQDPSGVVDTVLFLFDQKAFEKFPTLTLTLDSAAPGQLVDFGIAGLTPGESFELRVQDQIVLTDIVESDGSFGGSFILPTLAPGDYFVVAQDATGPFAFNVIEALRPSTGQTILVYGPASGSSSFVNKANSFGHDVTVFSAAQWTAGTTATFQQFDVIAIPTVLSVTQTTTLAATNAAWGSAITGNIVITGLHADQHFQVGATQYLENALAFAAANSGTGFVSLADCFTSPAYSWVPPTGPFVGLTAGSCTGTQSVTVTDSTHPLTTTPNVLTDGLLSNWNQSVHTFFPTVGGFTVIATSSGGGSPPNSPTVLVAGAELPPADGDDDGVPDAEDNCPRTPNPSQADSNFDGIGDACQETVVFDTTGFLQPNLDGSSSAEATDLGAGEPALEEQLTRIIEFRIEELGFAFEEATDLLEALVGSQVALGVVDPEEADNLVQNVIEALNQPPEIECNGAIELWPPQHDLIDVSSAFTVTDPDGDPVTCTFRVYSNEREPPGSGDGLGRFAPDFKTTLASGAEGVFLRGERSGRAEGRHYTVVIIADDGNGGVTTKLCTLAYVPHDQNDPASIQLILGIAAANEAIIQLAVDADNLPDPPADPTDPLPAPLLGLFQHGLSQEFGPKQ